MKLSKENIFKQVYILKSEAHTRSEKGVWRSRYLTFKCISFIFIFCLFCMHEYGGQRFTLSTFFFFLNQSSPYYLRQNLSVNLEFTYVIAAWPVGSVTHLSPPPCCCFVGACHRAWLSDASAGDPHSGPHALWPALYPLSPLNASYLGMIPSLISYLTLSN